MAQLSAELPSPLTHHVFMSYNSADPEAKALVKTVAAAFAELELKAWDYEVDANRGFGTSQSVLDGAQRSASFAYVIGPRGPGNNQSTNELNYLLAAIGKKDAPQHLFLVMFPGVTTDQVPQELSHLQTSQVRMEPGYFSNGVLAEDGLARICAGCLRGSDQEASNWIGQRRRELFKVPPKRARALLVGVSQYQNPDLQPVHGPHDDTNELAKVLRAMEVAPGVHWEVSTLLDPVSENLGPRVERFFTQSVEPDDMLLFYFSGHGVYRDGTCYMLAADALAEAPALKSLNDNLILDLLNASPAMARIVILDCCHAAGIVLEESPYNRLKPGGAVFGASRGPTEAAGLDDALSPYTQALNTILSRLSSAIDLRTLAGELRGRFERSWAIVERAGRASLGRSLQTASQNLPTLYSSERRLTVTKDSLPAERAELLRQLALTLDSLLAMAPLPDDIPSEVLHKGMALLAGGFREAMRTPDGEPAQWHPPSRADLRELIGVTFADERFADLPWEYAGFCPDPDHPNAAGAWLWSGQTKVGRLVLVPPTKSAPLANYQRAAVLTAGPSVDAAFAVLADRTEKEIAALGGVAEYGIASYRKVRAIAPNNDLLVLQAPVGMKDDLPTLMLPQKNETSPDSMSADVVRTALQDGQVRCIAIETLATRLSPLAAGLTRRLATQVAQQTQRSVVAICHQYAYTRLVQSAVSESDGEDASLQLSFGAALIKRLRQSPRLADAAHRARDDVLASLGRSASSVVGMPIVVRAEEASPEPGGPRLSPAPALREGSGASGGSDRGPAEPSAEAPRDRFV